MQKALLNKDKQCNGLNKKKILVFGFGLFGSHIYFFIVKVVIIHMHINGVSNVGIIYLNF